MRAVSPVMYSSKHTCISHGSMDGIAASTGSAYHITRALSSQKRPPQHAMVCHVVSSTSARSESSVPHLACALLLTARRCVPSAVAPERHSSVCLDAPTLAAATGASQSRTEATPTRRHSAKKFTPMRHFGSSFKRRCRHRGSFSLSSSPPPSSSSCSAAARRTMAARASRALAAARSASCGRRGRFKSKPSRAVARRFLAMQFLALTSVPGRSVLPASSNAEPHDMPSAVPMMSGCRRQCVRQ